jgi:hypothetical protein
MPRRQPNSLPEDAYYIVRKMHLPHPVLSHRDDHALIGARLPVALKRNGARLLGHCWMPDAIRLALQIDLTTSSPSVPVGYSKSFEGMSADNWTGHPGTRQRLQARQRHDFSGSTNGLMSKGTCNE